MPYRFYRWPFLLLALFLLATGGAAQGQNSANPLVILMDSGASLFGGVGDFYMWNGSGIPQKITTWGYNHAPVLSPDGISFTYNSEPQITIDARTSDPFQIEPPSNIWITNPLTLHSQQIARQPAEAQSFSANQPKYAVVRSSPTWSTDGTMLAWTEYTLLASTNRLLIYDLQRDYLAKTIDDIPARNDHSEYHTPLTSVQWTNAGLVVLTSPYNDLTQANEDQFFVYDTHGKLLRTIALAPNGSGKRAPIVRDFLPVSSDGQTYLATFLTDATGDAVNALVDPRTGTIAPLPQTLELSGASHALTVSMDTQSLLLEIHDAKGQSLEKDIDIGFDFRHVALSADGTAIAYIPQSYDKPHTVMVWQNGNELAIPSLDREYDPAALIWGPSYWHSDPG